MQRQASSGEMAFVSVKLEDLYRKHVNDIYRYLYKFTGDAGIAEDLTQDTFIRAFRFLDLYEGGKARPWLFKVAYHTFIDWYRKQKKEVTAPFQDLADQDIPTQTEQGPENHMLRKELWVTFEGVIAAFPLKQRHVLMLFYVYQLSYEEIAGVLDIPLSDVKSSIHRGRQKLRACWRME
jgi:RNA polymerase sigma-70 factor, ECF subfamily